VSIDLTRPMKFAKCIVTLAEVFNEPMSPVRIAATAEALQDLPIEDLEIAARQIIKADEFFPRPARWREVALEVIRAQREAERQERARGHQLAQDVGSPEEQAARAKEAIAELAARMGWPRSAPAPASRGRHLRSVGPRR
jgi:hypothetical protein